jgi:hypothetical protein
MTTSPELDQIAPALAAAQGALTNPTKDAEAHVTSAKGSYSYGYLSLPALLDVVRPVFAAHGLSIVQAPSLRGDGNLVVTTRILHASGQWVEDDLACAVGDARPQSVGTAITYLRRYALASFAGIAADEDDDAVSHQADATPASRPSGAPKHRLSTLSEHPVGSKRTVVGTVVDLVADTKPYKVVLADDAGIEHVAGFWSELNIEKVRALMNSKDRCALRIVAKASKDGRVYDNVDDIGPVIDTPLPPAAPAPRGTPKAASLPPTSDIPLDDIPFLYEPYPNVHGIDAQNGTNLHPLSGRKVTG